MAKEYAAPLDPPDISTEQLMNGSYKEIEDEYIERLKTETEKTYNNSGDLVGKVIRFQRGDGYAQYMVWSQKPLSLIWLDLGDAWDVEPALIRGLRVTDVREHVRREESIRELFGRRDAD